MVNVAKSLIRYFISPYLVFQILGLQTRWIVEEGASNPSQHHQLASEPPGERASQFCV